jgi:oxygen-independent coproporphyrinogen-3 oxidase
MKHLYTIYIGGGTPTSLGVDGLIELIDHLGQYHDLTAVAELTIECNPDPHEEMIALIQKVSTYYKKLPRIRRNIGVQSFDDVILHESHRQYTFNSLVGFLRDLQKIKDPHMCYNLDFIAFGKLHKKKNGDIQLWDDAKLRFFDAVAGSGVFDGFSLYTLELFPGSTWYEQKKHLTTHEESGYGMRKYGDDDSVYTEFTILKDILLSHGYQRYELSNFAAVSKQSIHNHIYRSMEPYVGVGTSASGLVYEDKKRKRVTNTRKLTDYLTGKRRDETQTVVLTDQDRLIE